MLVSTMTLSSNLLPVSAGAANITRNEHLLASALPTHLFGSSTAKLVPTLTLMLLMVGFSVPGSMVTVLDVTLSASTLPNSTGEGESEGLTGSPNRVMTRAFPPAVLILPVPDCLPEGQTSVSEEVVSVPGV